MLVHPECARDGHAQPRHALAVAEGVGVGRLERLAPLAHHREIGGLELGHLPGDVDQVGAGVESPEQAVRGVQQGERLLVPAHRLIQQGELARRFRLVQHRSRAHRQLDRRLEPRLGERRPARLAVDHPEHTIRVGLGAPHAQLIEHGQGGFGVQSGVLVSLPGDVHLGVVHQAQASEVGVARAIGDLVTLPEVALRFVVPRPVRARHAEVVVGDRAPVVVVRLAVGLEGAPVARQRFVEVPLNVRENPQVLLGPGTELAAVPAQQNLGILANIQGDFDEALARYGRSLAAYCESNDDHGRAIAYHNLGMASADRARYDEAECYFRQSHEIAERTGDAYLGGLCLVNHAKVHVARGRYENARRHAEAALAVFDQLGVGSAKADAYRVLGMIYRETGRPALAESRPKSAIELAVGAASVLNEAEASRELALLYQTMGRNQEALSLLNAAHRLFGRLDARAHLVHVAGKMAELEATYLAVVREW